MAESSTLAPASLDNTGQAAPASWEYRRRKLSISVVTFDEDLELFERALRSLVQAVQVAQRARVLGEVELNVIHNGDANRPSAGALEGIARREAGSASIAAKFIAGHGNIGFGAAHNIALESNQSEFHLVLNPDVVLEPDALLEGLRYLRAHPEVSLVAPSATWPDGRRQYLCKSYPSVLTLALRAWGGDWLQRLFRRCLAAYEMREECAERDVVGVQLASGCFMLLRGSDLAKVGGFDERYFLYFEDFDLSLRIRAIGSIAYVPGVRIVHAGGSAARKGLRHVLMFVRSAFVFFQTHGWRWW